MQITIYHRLFLIFLSLAEVGYHCDHAVTILLLKLLIGDIVLVEWLILRHQLDILGILGRSVHQLLLDIDVQV